METHYQESQIKVTWRYLVSASESSSPDVSVDFWKDE